MTYTYIIAKQDGHKFWWFTVKHTAFMLNQVPGRINRRLTTPYDLVYGRNCAQRHGSDFPLLATSNHDKDNTESHSTSQAQTLEGIAVGRDDRTNTIIFYNPLTKSYYHPPAFCLDALCLPVTNIPSSIRFDCDLTFGILQNWKDPVPEPFPPGTCA